MHKIIETAVVFKYKLGTFEKKELFQHPVNEKKISIGTFQ